MLIVRLTNDQVVIDETASVTVRVIFRVMIVHQFRLLYYNLYCPSCERYFQSAELIFVKVFLLIILIILRM